jgi:hypothetical protein
MMAGLEVVVRPVVFPNIRPSPARILPPQDDPTKGIAVISGGGGGLIDLPFSFNMSFTSQASVGESRRQFDKERVYRVDEKGNVDKNTYVDLERLSRVRLEYLDGPQKLVFAKPPEVANVETLEKDVTRENK